MTPQQHYERAEDLLAEGVKAVMLIGQSADARSRFRSSGDLNLAQEMTAQMDELGKKAMGIWAQAQVHATLATLPLAVVETRDGGQA